jgi:hypothetical protein
MVTASWPLAFSRRPKGVSLRSRRPICLCTPSCRAGLYRRTPQLWRVLHRQLCPGNGPQRRYSPPCRNHHPSHLCSGHGYCVAAQSSPRQLARLSFAFRGLCRANTVCSLWAINRFVYRRFHPIAFRCGTKAHPFIEQTVTAKPVTATHVKRWPAAQRRDNQVLGTRLNTIQQ